MADKIHVFLRQGDDRDDPDGALVRPVDALVVVGLRRAPGRLTEVYLGAARADNRDFSFADEIAVACEVLRHFSRVASTAMPDAAAEATALAAKIRAAAFDLADRVVC